MDAFKEMMILTRVINTGVIMSIEKNEMELKGLELELTRLFKFTYCSFFNSFCAAIHSALYAHNYRHNDSVTISSGFLTSEISRFLQYLGLRIDPTDRLEKSLITSDIGLICLKSSRKSVINASTAVIDFTQLGYGPAACLLTNDRKKYLSAERLKIFGFPDLQTMWEDREKNPNIPPTIQFNYRLSPLVAALIKNSLLEEEQL